MSDALLTQEQVENQMYYGGIARAEKSMADAEARGHAHQNPYAKEVMRDYVLPLAEVIKQDCQPTGKRGVSAAHLSLLRPLNPEAVALLAVRYALNVCMDTREDATDRTVGYKIGTAVHSELVLFQIEAEFPDLYHVLANDLGRRQSKNERHRMTVMKMQAAKQGFDLVEWPIGARQQVGSYLLGLLLQAGMLVMEEPMMNRGKREYRPVSIHPDLMARIGDIKSYVAITCPVYGPCVEPPRDWTTPRDGGFHTPNLRRVCRSVIHASSTAREVAEAADMPIFYAAVNALQRTAWQVNGRILDVLFGLSEAGVHTDEVVSVYDKPKPPPPGWLLPDMGKESMTEEQRNQFQEWKRHMSEWYTDKKLSGTRFARFYSATRAAAMFREYPALHFVYFADSRGRLYPMTYGVNPQGSDLQKALLRFSDGKPLDTEDALRWFHIHGANKWGFDKATLTERFLFVHERREEFLHYAADPINHTGWLDADAPLQFLAWCLEYADWVADPDGFRSHLPVSMDGSCNGLQNLSAMLRDEIGGRATNLTNNETMQDIYKLVAEAATARMQVAVYEDETKERLRQLWLSHGIARSVVKRSVMTTPYGVSHRSATDYVIEDYLKRDKGHPFLRDDFRGAAQVLMDSVWPAIGDVVVKGRLAMDWLKRSARCVIKEIIASGEEPVIWWPTPSGFPASQAYFAAEVHRIRTRLVGEERIRVLSETDEPDIDRHASGLAPNFVHSMDAAHMHRVAAAASAAGIGHLAMIHDDYGTHAADSQRLYELIRREFVSMYEWNDVIAQFAAKYPAAPEPPEKGALNIKEVLESKFFFS